MKEELQGIKDPRRTIYGNIRHKLEDIVIIGLCSIISCGEDFIDMEEFGKDREDWLRGFLELPNGIPDSDTFRRVYERLDSKYLSKALNNWLNAAGNAGGRSIGIDGKTIRGSANIDHKAYHVVSAWVNENSITLGEIVTDEHSNEITAISSFDTTAENFCKLIRGHWSIENQLHWVLDVTLREDASKARKDNSPLNLNVLRKTAANLLKAVDVGYLLSIRKKMMKAARDPDFLETLLFKK